MQVSIKQLVSRKIEFTLKLKRVDDSLSTMFGDLNEQMKGLF